MSNFLRKTRALLTSKFQGLTIPDTREVLIGRIYQAVLLEGTMGVGYAPRKATTTCTVFRKPGELYQTSSTELADMVLSEEPLERAVGLAAVNALSQLIISSRSEEYNRYTEIDMLKHLPLSKDTKVGMVGIIGPFINFLAKNSAGVTILDDNPAFSEGSLGKDVVLSRKIEDIEESDVLIITGSTTIEHSLEVPLKAASSAVFRMIVGPTASWIPDAAFQLGVDAVSGMTFIDMEKAFRTIMEGGGTRNFSKYAEKYTLTAEELPNCH
ncbi:MAG: Rossmann-like domain-containing protein [Promethearchaeota archaeon]